MKLPEDHRIKSENTDQSGKVLPDRSTKPVFPPTAMLTDEEKARIHEETALLMEKNKQEKELWERQQREQKEKLRREEQERTAGKIQDSEERDVSEDQPQDGLEKRDSRQTKTEEKEPSADRAQEATGTKRQSKSEPEASDAKMSVEGKRCPTSGVQKRPADVSPASVSGELSASKVRKTHGNVFNTTGQALCTVLWRVIHGPDPWSRSISICFPALLWGLYIT